MYDIIVFDPALVSDDEFPVWWEEGAPVETADDPGAMTPGLQALYHELRRYFPAMDGPDAVDDATLRARPGMGGYVRLRFRPASHVHLRGLGSGRGSPGAAL